MTVAVLPWQHPSELAFVRDCFYPHRAASSSFAALHNSLDVYDFTLADGVQDAFGPLTSQDKKIQNYKLGLKSVAIWNLRSAGRVSTAVSTTAAFIDVKVHDEGEFQPRGGRTTVTIDLRGEKASPVGDVSTSSISPSGMQNMYAMAFLRFVNGFVDRDVSRDARKTGLSQVPTASGNGNGNGDADDGIGNGGDDNETVSVIRSQGESSMYTNALAIGMPDRFVDLRHRCAHGHGQLPDLELLRRTTDEALEWLWERWWKQNADGDSGRWVWEMERRKGHC